MSVDDAAVELWREAFAAFESLCELGEETRTRELEALGRTRPDLHPYLLKLFTDYDQA